MIVQDAINRVDRIKPNAFTDEDKMLWLDSLEGMIQSEIYLRCPETIVRIKSLEDALSAPFPYDALYDLYLQAMIDFHNGEYDKYNTTYAMFNSKWEDFSVWYTTHYPTIGSVMFGNTEVSCNHQGDGSDDNSGDDKQEDEEMIKTVILKYATDDATDDATTRAGAGVDTPEMNFTSEGATFEELVAELKAGRPVAAYVCMLYRENGEAISLSYSDAYYLEKGGAKGAKDDIIVFYKDMFVSYSVYVPEIYWFQGKISTVEPNWQEK